MRSLMLILFLSAQAAFAAAGDAPTDKPVLDVRVKLHHSRQWTRVYEGKDGWYCATENNPMYPIPGKPKTLALARNENGTKAGCRETFTATFGGEKDAKTWSGCKKGEAERFLHDLGHECGRF